MTAPTDRVQLLKQESTALGGEDAQSVPYPSPINPQQDAPEVMGIFVQDASNRDEAVYITRLGPDLVLCDLTVGAEVTLANVTLGAIAPLYVASNQVFHVPRYKQVLYDLIIDCDGVLDLDGVLTEVS